MFKKYLIGLIIIFFAFFFLLFTFSPVLAADNCASLGGACQPSDEPCGGNLVPVSGHCLQGYLCCLPPGLQSSTGFFKEAGNKAGFGSAGAQLEPEVVIGRIIEGALVIIGTIFGILMVYAGYLWMQARGNEEYVKKAKGILEAAIIGIILVMAAYAITAFVVSRVIGAANFGVYNTP